MPPKKRTRDTNADDYESDNGFIASDDEQPQSKKSRATTKPAANTPSSNEPVWELSRGKNSRRVGVSEFKGTRFVNIREYYQNPAGDFLPGKKGISLNLDQYRAFLGAVPKINAALADMGESVDVDVEKDPPRKTESNPKAGSKEKEVEKEKKANIDATSDEEDE